jgi:hypothetical protein
MQQTKISEVTTAFTMTMTVFCPTFLHILKVSKGSTASIFGDFKNTYLFPPLNYTLVATAAHRHLQETTCEAGNFGSSILQPINKLILSPYTTIRSQDQVTTKVALPTVPYSRCHSLRRILSAAHYDEHNPVKRMPEVHYTSTHS